MVRGNKQRNLVLREKRREKEREREGDAPGQSATEEAGKVGHTE